MFRAALDECREILRPLLARDLLDILHAGPTDASAALNDTTLTQPALLSLEYALFKLWRVGRRPSAVAGHSLGEIDCGLRRGDVVV